MSLPTVGRPTSRHHRSEAPSLRVRPVRSEGVLSWTCRPPSETCPRIQPPRSEPDLPDDDAPTRHRGARLPPLRFVPLQRVPDPGQRLEWSRGPTLDSPAPSGFPNLLTLSSAPSLPAMFQTGPAHGVSALQSIFLPRSRTPSPAPPALLASGLPIEPARHGDAVALS